MGLLVIFFGFLNLHFITSSFSFAINTTSAHLCSYDQSHALVNFKNSFTINPNASIDSYYGFCSSSFHPRTNSWHEGQDCCNWDGVTCDITTGQVIGLDLSCSWLQGKLSPNSSLFLLQDLQILNLAFNNFSESEIPESIGNLTNLRYLCLDSNFLFGTIPPSIAYLTHLEYLGLRFNQLVGSIPNFSNLSLLHTINLEVNFLSGTIPFYMYSFPLLRKLYLSYNQFIGGQLHPFQSRILEYIDLRNCRLQGPIPATLFPHGANQLITTLYLGSNSLNGTIPSSLFTLPSLLSLDLSYNQLDGGIPEFKSTSLKVIYLSNNKLQGNIPSSIAYLTHLEYLNLSFNELVGSIPNFSNLSLLHTINLEVNFLSGTIPFYMYSFPLLRELYLSYNQFIGGQLHPFQSRILEDIYLIGCGLQGPIPTILFPHGANQLLGLDFYNNSLNGIIPSSLFALPSLHWLFLSGNQLVGGIPELKSTSLEIINLSHNKLQGDVPTLICNTPMRVFDLSRNYFSGTIPECLGNMSTLDVLDLSMNKFHGKILKFAGHENRRLKTLKLNGNQLEGNLPVSLVNCRNLEVLDIGNNNIYDTFPHWLRFLTQLKVLVLKSNNFHGYIHDYKYQHSFQRLRILDISDNNFVGSLPTKYIEGLEAMKKDMLVRTNDLMYMEWYYGSGARSYYRDSISLTIKGSEIQLEKILTTLMTIDFSKNKFGGEIPQVIGTLISLKSLNLSHNNLFGHIPSSIENLGNLESLDLSSNKLDGTIPTKLASLTFLAKLNLSQNVLVGPIPHGSQFDTFDESSYQGNSALCGPPLSNKCELEKSPSLLHEEHDSDDDDFDKKIIFYGYLSGLVIGLSIGYIVFSSELPIWLAKMVQRYRLRNIKGQT